MDHEDGGEQSGDRDRGGRERVPSKTEVLEDGEMREEEGMQFFL